MQFNFSVDDTPSASAAVASKPPAAAKRRSGGGGGGGRGAAGSEFESYHLPTSFRAPKPGGGSGGSNKRKFDANSVSVDDDGSTGGGGGGGDHKSTPGSSGGRKGGVTVGAPGGVRIHLDKRRTAAAGTDGTDGGGDGDGGGDPDSSAAAAAALKKQKIAEARARPLPNVRAPQRPAPISGGSSGGAAAAAGSKSRSGGGGAATRDPRPAGKELFFNAETAKSDATGSGGAANGASGGGSGAAAAATTFEELGVSAKLVANLKEHMKMTQPTRIQSNAIPYILRGADVMVKSATGSGKTLSYLLPIVHKLDSLPVKLKREDGTKAIIMSPTRELCIQIQTVLSGLLRVCHHIVPGTVMGGEKKKSEKSRIRKGVNILIATPGRLLDHLKNTAVLNVADLRFLVMDEADRLLDLGFERDVNEIVALLTTQHLAAAPRQNLLVSATLHSGVQRLITLALREPVYIGFQENGKALTGATAAAAAQAIAEADSKNTIAESTAQTATTAAAATTPLNDAAVEVDEGDDDDDDDSGDGGAGAAGGEADSAASSDKVVIKAKPAGTAATREEKMKKAAAKAEADLAAAAAASHNPLPSTLTQHYIQVNSTQRLTALASFLRWQIHFKRAKNQQLKAVVFVNTCACVEFHWKLFSHSFWPDLSQEEGYVSDDDATKVKPPLLDTVLYKLHGNMLQEDRTRTYHDFCEASGGILFCTDVAARGLDLPAVDWIVQYDPPEELQEYVHRVGRTARMGRKGEAILFLNGGPELGYLTVLQQRAIALKPLMLPRVLGGLHIVENEKAKVTFSKPPALILQQQFERLVVSQELNLHARAAFQTWLRAYTAYPKSLKHIFHHRNLHLGHVARSFGLKEQPSKLGTNLTKELFQKHEKSKLSKTYRDKVLSGQIVPGSSDHKKGGGAAGSRTAAAAANGGGDDLDASTAVVEMDDDGNTISTTVQQRPVIRATASAGAAAGADGKRKPKPKPLTEEQKREREIASAALASLTPAANKKRTAAAAAGAEGSGTGSFGRYGKGMVKPKQPVVSAKQQMMKKQSQFVSEFAAN